VGCGRAFWGGELQGCRTALASAERGLNDLSRALLDRTAVWNEGEIHLDYTYVADLRKSALDQSDIVRKSVLDLSASILGLL
jgi:hypothetical protein